MKMKELDSRERPREKLIDRGPGALSDAELVAIFIGSGTAGDNALDVSRTLLASVGWKLSQLSALTAEGLMSVKGIGPKKAAAIAAALELGKRFLSEGEVLQRRRITGAAQVFRHMRPLLKGLAHEECWVLFLNRATLFLGQERLTTGTESCTLFDPRTVVRRALEKRAAAVILVHNHPTGNPMPGEADIRATQQLRTALHTFDIDLLDHVVMADDSYFSFNEERLVRA